MTAAEAEAELNRIEALFAVLPDSGAIYAEWRRLVSAHQVVGKSAHDARLVAAMKVHGVTHILTLNTAHYTRYPAIVVLDPTALSGTSGP